MRQYGLTTFALKNFIMKMPFKYTLESVLSFLLITAVLSSISNTAFSQCSTAAPPVYSNSCTEEYYKILTATGSAGVTSTINYTGTACTGTYYSYYAAPLGPQGISTPLGATINVNIKKATGYNAYVSIYVDWNNDGIYEAAELAGTQLFFSTTTSTQTYTFTVPTTGVVAGVNLHMRIMLSELTGGAPCNANYGETCDYFLNVGCAPSVITVSPTSGSFCAGGAGIALTASGAGTGGTYTWAPSTGLSAATGATVTATPVVTTIYTVTGTSSGGCSDTATATVSVNPLPSATITPSGSLSFCAGSSVMLNTPTTTGYLYQWYNNTVSIAGATNASYTATLSGNYTVLVTNNFGCSATSAITIVTVNPAPSPIYGPVTVCQGSTITMTDNVTGGTWSSSNTSVATIGLATGIVSGIFGGTTVITYTSGGCTPVTQVITIYPVNPILGVPTVCTGLTTTLSDAISGGTWACSNTSVASIGSSSGFIAGLTAGTSTIIYQFTSGCTASIVLTVNLSPVAISGTATLCYGNTTTLFDGTPGGTWTSSNIGIAMIGATTGITNAVSTTGGTTIISYIMPSTGCNAVTILTVDPSPDAVSGILTVCTGLTTSLTDVTAGGSWSCNDIIGGPVSPTGVVAGILAGTDVVTYTLPGGCTASVVLTINISPVAISGTTTLCYGNTATFLDGTPGGTWASSNTGIATIVATNGITNAVSTTGGTTIISYTIPSTGCNAVTILTVNPAPDAISGILTVCTGLTTFLTDGTLGGGWSCNDIIGGPVSPTGLVTGILAGTDIVSYTLPTGCYATVIVTINSSPQAIEGNLSLCVGLSSLLTDATSGGTWSSINTAVGAIGSVTGIISALSAGTSIISYTFTSGCNAVATITVNPVPLPISGTLNSCAGYFVPLSDASAGGVWSSNNTLVATIGSSTGLVYAATTGISTIEYSFISTGCSASAVFTVNPSPVAIDGTPDICAGLTTSFNDPTPGGTWSSSNANVMVGSLSGVVEGLTPGTATIIYSLSTNCFITYPVTITPPPGAIGGPSSVCHSSDITLTDGTHPGTWSVTPSSGTASITASGVLAGLSSGVVIVSYTTLACTPVTFPVLVNPLPDPISGIGNLCQGSGTSLSDATMGGTWASSNTSVTVSSTGIVTGLDTGSNTYITYTLPTGCYVDVPVVVFPIPSSIMGVDSVCPGSYVILSDTTSGGVWSSSNASVATSIALTGKVEGATSGTVNISYTLVSGCYVTMPFKVETPLPASLTIIQTPDTLLCANTPVTLKANWTNGGSPTFVWELFGSEYMGDADTLSYNPSHGDYITCIMTTDSICSSPAVVEAGIVLNIYPEILPVVAVSAIQSDTATYLGEVYTFFTNVTNGGLNPTYQWYENNVAIPGATNTSFTTHIYENNDSVYCIVTGNSPCDTGAIAATSNTMVIYGMNYLSVSSLITTGNGLSIFPNPNTGKFVVETGLNSNQSSVEVFDVVGKKVYESILNSTHTEIDISSQPGGIYLVQVTELASGARLIKKLLKE